MKIFVKVLKGDSCAVDVNENTTILEIKNQIEQMIKVPVAQQTLILLGKSLVDDNLVSNYPRIKDGTKLHLIVKKPECIQEVMGKFLRKYYSEIHTKAIIEEFMKDFSNKMSNLSLDDYEKMAASYLNEENV